MTWAKPQTIERLFTEACNMPVVDAHTHIQDDLTDFGPDLAARNLAGTQAAANAYPDYAIQAGLRKNRLARRTMMDVTHACMYSWFAQVAEGRRGHLDAILATLGDNSEQHRKRTGLMLLEELQDSRHTEYAEWLRFMFRLYDGLDNRDPLDPKNFEQLWEAVNRRRGDPDFAAGVLAENNILGYVTSIENRDKIPFDLADAKVGNVDLSYATHAEACSMFDAHYLVWPEGATDFGLFTAGHKYEAEKYLANLERIFGITICDARQLREGVKDFLHQILFSPTRNPASRVRYTNLFHPMDYRFGRPYDTATVNHAIRFRKQCLRADDVKQLSAFVTEAMLEALDEIGRDLKQAGSAYGSCLQSAIGVSYFMDQSREIQSFPLYAAGIPQDEYPVWMNYPNVHFEYIVAHPQLYEDFSNAAKQVGNVSVGPWWHFFRRHKIAAMLHDQLSMGPISAIASGFTDARFVEMLAAKYRTVRWAVAAALAELVDDPASSLNEDAAIDTMCSILLKNPIEVHHLPFHKA